MNDIQIHKLKKVAAIFHHWGQFSSLEQAEQRLLSDYPKGYPSDSFVDGILEAQNMSALIFVDLNEQGNYHYLREGRDNGDS